MFTILSVEKTSKLIGSFAFWILVSTSTQSCFCRFLFEENTFFIIPVKATVFMNSSSYTSPFFTSRRMVYLLVSDKERLMILPEATGLLLRRALKRSKEKLVNTNKKATHFSLSFQLFLNRIKAKMGIIQQYNEISASK